MEETGYGKSVVVLMEGQSPGGTILEIDAGKKTDMSFHIDSDKVVYLLSGEAIAWVVKDGQMSSLRLKPGASFYVRRGLVHQLEAVERAIVIEFSSNVHIYTEDKSVIQKGSQLPVVEPVEPGDLAKMTEEDDAALEAEAPAKKVTKKKRTRKTASKGKKKVTKKTRATKKKR